jgi:hypothetical protein
MQYLKCLGSGVKRMNLAETKCYSYFGWIEPYKIALKQIISPN